MGVLLSEELTTVALPVILGSPSRAVRCCLLQLLLVCPAHKGSICYGQSLLGLAVFLVEPHLTATLTRVSSIGNVAIGYFMSSFVRRLDPFKHANSIQDVYPFSVLLMGLFPTRMEKLVILDRVLLLN